MTVAEWVAEWYGADYYSSGVEYVNPNGPLTGEYREVRDGTWKDSEFATNKWNRHLGIPIGGFHGKGIRCVRSE